VGEEATVREEAMDRDPHQEAEVALGRGAAMDLALAREVVTVLAEELWVLRALTGEVHKV